MGETAPDIQLRFYPHANSVRFNVDLETPTTTGGRYWLQSGKGFYESAPQFQLGNISDYDVERLVWGVNQARSFAKLPSLAKLLVNETAPGGATITDPAALAAWVRTSAAGWNG